MNDTLKGIIVGVGISAVAFCAYKKNEDKVNRFLRSKGVKVGNSSMRNYQEMTLDELFEEKEIIEDVIAERELFDDEELDFEEAPSQV